MTAPVLAARVLVRPALAALALVLIGSELRIAAVADDAVIVPAGIGRDTPIGRVGIVSSGGGAAADAAVVEADDARDGVVATSTTFRRRPYVAIGAGVSRVEPRSPSPALTVAEDISPGFELGLGYDFTRWLTGEFHVADLGAAEIEFLGSDVGDIGYQVFGASALFYLLNSRDGFVPFTSSRDGAHRREGLSFFGRFGLGGLQNDSDRVAYRRDHPSHAVFGAGLEYGFHNGFALRAELQAFDTDARYAGVGVLKRFGGVSPVVPPVAVPPARPPAAALPAPPVAPSLETPLVDPFDMPIVHFAFDRSDLSTSALASLDAFADAMDGDERVIAIDGHTDWIGPEIYNEGLSDRRADAVRDHLVARGMDPARLIARGFGETRPVTKNTTDEGRALNRRAEIRPEG